MSLYSSLKTLASAVLDVADELNASSVAYGGGVPPDPVPTPAPTPGDPSDPHNALAFGWPGTWLAFYGPYTTKQLPVPEGFEGIVGLWIGKLSGNVPSECVFAAYLDGVLVAENLHANVDGDWLKFNAIGGKTYQITALAPGMAASVNLVIGG